MPRRFPRGDLILKSTGIPISASSGDLNKLSSQADSRRCPVWGRSCTKCLTEPERRRNTCSQLDAIFAMLWSVQAVCVTSLPPVWPREKIATEWWKWTGFYGSVKTFHGRIGHRLVSTNTYSSILLEKIFQFTCTFYENRPRRNLSEQLESSSMQKEYVCTRPYVESFRSDNEYDYEIFIARAVCMRWVRDKSHKGANFPPP